MIRVNRPPDVHDDQIAALRPVDAYKPGRLVVLLVQAGAFRVFPPAVCALEGFEFQTPFALVPLGTNTPTVPNPMNKWAIEQRGAAHWSDRPEIALGPTQDVPGQLCGLAHGQVVR